MPGLAPQSWRPAGAGPRRGRVINFHALPNGPRDAVGRISLAALTDDMRQKMSHVAPAARDAIARREWFAESRRQGTQPAETQ